MSEPQFSIKIDQNRYLPEGGREVHAIVSVEATAADGAPVPSTTRAAEVIIIDTSGSMSYPGRSCARRSRRRRSRSTRCGTAWSSRSSPGPTPPR